MAGALKMKSIFNIVSELLERSPKAGLVPFFTGACVAAVEGFVVQGNHLLGFGGLGLAAGALALYFNKAKTAGVTLLLANAGLTVNGVALSLGSDLGAVEWAGALLAFGNAIYALANSELLTDKKMCLTHAQWSGVASLSLLGAGVALGDPYLLTSAGLFVLDAAIRLYQDHLKNKNAQKASSSTGPT